MAALLALTAAAAYGAGDFLGGLASRRAPATAVVLWSHIAGLLTVLVAAPLMAGHPTPSALAYGAAAGVIGGLGVALFYRAMSMGSISVVAPIAGLFSAIVPVVAGVLRGERPEVAAILGTAVALVAITLVSRVESIPALDEQGTRHEARAVLFALAAGFAFGLFFTLVGSAGDDVGIWPLVGARSASVAMFGLLALVGVTRAARPREVGGAAIAAGMLDITANIAYVMAVSHGLLSVVAVLTSLYPAGTVLLARYVLGERMSTVQQVGLGSAALAAALIAA